MDRSPATPSAIDVSPAELRVLLAHTPEDEYVLVDVRQPEEYEQGHLPGAKLLPLPEFEYRLEEIWQLRDRTVVFYCHSGVRSRLAATLAAEGLELPRAYNLRGGICAWEGVSLPGLPELRSIDTNGSVPALLAQAIDLEKGVHLYYATLATRSDDEDVALVARELSKAELAHAEAIHRQLAEGSKTPVAPFSRFFDALPGRLLESGESWEELLTRVKPSGPHGRSQLLEFALTLEFRALDLYKNLAARATGTQQRRILLDLAEQEKGHALSLVNSLASLAARATQT